MHVFPSREDLLQHRLLGGVGEHAQLDLRVVGGDQHAPLLGLEAAADLAAQAVRIGTFCMLGLVLDRRPVWATACRKVVWMRERSSV